MAGRRLRPAAGAFGAVAVMVAKIDGLSSAKSGVHCDSCLLARGSPLHRGGDALFVAWMVIEEDVLDRARQGGNVPPRRTSCQRAPNQRCSARIVRQTPRRLECEWNIRGMRLDQNRGSATKFRSRHDRPIAVWSCEIVRFGSESARPSRIRMNVAFFNKVGMIHGYHHENREAGASGKSHQY